MSTKIYNGLKAKDSNPFIAMAHIKQVIEPLFYEKFSALVAEAEEAKDATWADRFILEGKEWEKPIADSRWPSRDVYKIVEELRQARSWYSPADIGYDVTLMPNGKGRPLVLVFGLQVSDYVQALVSANVVEEYGYWNNSDRPEEISASAWGARAKAWNRITVPPAEAGLSFSFPGFATTHLAGKA